MLEKIDPKKTMDKNEYDRVMPDLIRRMGEVQRAAEALRIPVIIVFEGAQTAGKGEQINHLAKALDPRGYDVFAINDPDDSEALRPFFWRFWVRTPARGRISFFSRSWYHRTLEEERVRKDEDLTVATGEINVFEKELADDGCLFIKFFMHIGKKEQKERLEKLDKDPDMTWMVTGREWKEHKKLEKYLEDFDALMERTNTVYAPWTVVESEDLRFAEVKIFTTVISRFKNAIEEARAKAANSGQSTPENPAGPSQIVRGSALDKVDLTVSMSDHEYHEQLPRLQKAILKAQSQVYRKKVPVVVVFEGWDAAGKGGDIKRLTESLDPRAYRVVPIGAPTTVDKNQHYLWRFWHRFPTAGHIAIFDRSWYGRVLVERVEGFCSPDEWQRAYGEINDMESQLAGRGTVLVKFWLEISEDEQLRRFEAREKDADKTWKITADDWRNREKWDKYRSAVNEMILRTSTQTSPWTIVESDDKNYSRVKTLRTVLDAMREKL